LKCEEGKLRYRSISNIDKCHLQNCEDIIDSLNTDIFLLEQNGAPRQKVRTVITKIDHTCIMYVSMDLNPHGMYCRKLDEKEEANDGLLGT